LSRASLVLTDSGGIQEETTALGVPSLTLRENTERPVTILKGTNVLVGDDPGKIQAAALDALGGRVKKGGNSSAMGRQDGGAHRKRTACSGAPGHGEDGCRLEPGLVFLAP
jgi:UDP-N-acetylglucosamine 2-epimerase